MKVKGLIIFLMLVCLVSFAVTLPTSVYAQEEDPEDEEPVQTKPNPMEQTTKGAKGRMMKGMSSKSKVSKGLTSYDGVDGESQGKAIGKMEKGEKGASASAKAMQKQKVADDGQHGDGKVKNINENQAASALQKMMGTKEQTGYGNINTSTTGAQSAPGQQAPGNPAGWDPTDMNAPGSLEQEFGGSEQFGGGM